MRLDNSRRPYISAAEADCEIKAVATVAEIDGKLLHAAWWVTWIDEQERSGSLTAEQARNLRAQARATLGGALRRLESLRGELG